MNDPFGPGREMRRVGGEWRGGLGLGQRAERKGAHAQAGPGEKIASAYRGAE